MLTLIKDTHLRTAAIICLVLNVIIFAAVYVSFAENTDLLVVHFDSYKGIDFLGTRVDVLGFLMVSLAINVINFSLAAAFYNRERFLSRLFVYFSVFFSLLILISTAVIISINN